MSQGIGPLVLFGSGEISGAAQPIYDSVMADLGTPVRTSVLETPAGFQLNSADVAGAVADYLDIHLQNYRPLVSVVPARKKGTPYSPNDHRIVEPLLTAEMVFLGPGSPTYAARQLRDSLAWRIVQARHRMGYPIVMASAATIAASAWALPVYEIYKVGEDLHWDLGLDMLKPFGLEIVFVPHWNNNEGGAKHDTSRCYMGVPRFEQMRDLLDPDTLFVGIDEHTALVLDPGAGHCRVMGVGGVTVMRNSVEQRFDSGATIPCQLLGDWRIPPNHDIPQDVWDMIAEAERRLEVAAVPPDAVVALAERRLVARGQREWSQSDALRDEIATLGWQVRDTSDGFELEPLT